MLARALGPTIGVAVLVAFTVVELRASDPVLDLRLFLNPTFTISALLIWLILGVATGGLFLLPLFFENVQGKDGVVFFKKCSIAYLDAFAHARQTLVEAGERQGTTLSINWPYWEAGGMRANASRIQMMRDLLGQEPIGTETGMKTLYQALASGFAQVEIFLRLLLS